MTSSDCKIVQQCKFEGGKTAFKTIVQRSGCGELKTCVVINGSPTCVCKTGYIQDGRNGCLSKKYLLFLFCNTSIFLYYSSNDDFLLQSLNKIALIETNTVLLLFRGESNLSRAESHCQVLIGEWKENLLHGS